MKTAQINISVPIAWKDEIMRVARNYSVEKDQTFTYMDLVKMAIRKEFKLVDVKKESEND
jgi:hypothetical protein